MAEHYRSKHADKKSGGKIALLIVAIVLGIALLSGGVYALVHYVIMPALDAPAPTEAIPTFAPEPELKTPTAAPTEPPTEAPTQPAEEALAEQYLATMSDTEKIYQLFILTPDALTGVDGATVAGDTTKEKLAEYPVGGLMYTTGNLEDKEQTADLISGTQKFAKTPLFISVDEEGGDVARVAEKLGTTEFKPMYNYKDDGEETAQKNAETIGKDISALGFNLDFAPVADVWTNPDNTVIGDRAYSDDYEAAAKLVAAAVKGFRQGGVLCTLKHFPGHGDTAEDSHYGLATVSRTADELKAGELLPFKSGIEAGADMVMAGHLVVSDIDPDMPATLSDKVVPQLLRQHLGYDGIVITDAMNMDAITENYDYDTIVKGLFAADVDIILEPDDLDAYVKAIQKALEDGTLKQADIDRKVKKILALKYKNGIMKAEDAAPTEGATATATEPATQAPTAE